MPRTLLIGLVAITLMTLALGHGPPTSPARSAPVDLARLATRFTCTERVTVERIAGSRVDSVVAGVYDYLLVPHRRNRNVPYLYKERRSPKPKNHPDKTLRQPVPFSWLTLASPDPQMFRLSSSCEDADGGMCNEFSGTFEFQHGFDPREWRGKVWLDDERRLSRIEAQPVNQQGRLERLARGGQDDFGSAVGAPGGVPGLASFRVDGTVEEIHCEIWFAELMPGWLLPSLTECHRDSVGLRGKLRRRWTLRREFSACKEFGVETRELIELIR